MKKWLLAVGMLVIVCFLSSCVRPIDEPKKEASDFSFVTHTAGITYRWRKWWREPGNIRETIGNGCAFLDYNVDGNPDILLLGHPTALYQGDGQGHFREVSAETGIATLDSHYLGCAVGDFDNDGFPDLYLSAYRGGTLLRNINGKRYQNVTDRYRVPGQPFGTSCCFLDMNHDGFLDLFIGNYVRFGPDTVPQLCDDRGVKTSCGPRFYAPEFSVLLINENGQRFRVAQKNSFFPTTAGKALGVASAPGDTLPLLAIANDEMPGDLLIANSGRYKNQGETSGLAYDAQGNLHGGMGIDWGDFNNDGQLDLVVGTFYNEAKTLYKNTDGLFEDVSSVRGLAPLNPLVVFGVKFLDYDNDGLLDLIFASGHVQDNIDQIDPRQHYRQPCVLLRNQGSTGYRDASDRLPVEARRPIVGRGVAIGDYDNDGKIDLLIVDSEGEPLLLHNNSPVNNHFIGLRLLDRHGRDACNALVTIRIKGKSLTRACNVSGSYLSSSDSRVLIGLGQETTVEEVKVRWPDGSITLPEPPPIDCYTTLKQTDAL